MSSTATIFQGSFDRQEDRIKRKLAGEFLAVRSGAGINPTTIELPPDDDPRKADFVYGGELFQIVVPNQSVAEADIPQGVPVRSVAAARANFSDALKGKSNSAPVFGGDYLEDLTYTIKEKFDKYGAKISKDLILIIECVDIYLELFDFPIAPEILAEVKRRTIDMGINFKEIWLVKRWPINDEPTYIRQLKF